MRQTAIILLLLLCTNIALAGVEFPRVSGVYAVTEDSMRVKLSQMDLQPLEGIWYYPDEDMTVAIERYSASPLSQIITCYHIVLLSSNDIEVIPGTEIGYIEESAKGNTLMLHLFTERDDNGLLHSPVHCYGTLSDDASTLTFERTKWKVKVRVNFARWLPSLFKGISIIPEKEEKKAKEGFRKIFPNGGNGNPVNKIIYL